MLGALIKKLSALVLFLLAAACTHKPLPPANTLEVIAAAPAKGFHYPYILKTPTAARVDGTTYLLVEPNNTGRVSDDFAVHADAAKKLANSAVGSFVAKKLDLPLLVPIFPRPETGWETYTHALDRDSMLINDGPMRRLDLQLLAMIDDARKRLRGYGVDTHQKILLTGFSASGTFSNRFTLLHPEKVHAVATGGLNAMLIVPSPTLDAAALPYPLGISDLQQIADTRFDAAKWRAVPQFIYMGAKDDNDAVLFDDGYSESERAIVFKVLGEKMQPDRWTHMQKLYREAGANATFRTYEHMGHGTDGQINGEIAEFFRKTIE
jgi:dienelactone hydrolase